MTMKYYKDGSDAVYSFEADGSQDAYIPAGLTAITEGEAETLLAPPYASMIDAAKKRVIAGFEQTYQAHVEGLTGEPYSQAEITTWPMQEAEAWDYIQNGVAAITQWMDAYSVKTGITKSDIALETTQRVLFHKTIYIGLMAIRYDALTAIDALGASPSQEDLDAIVDAIEWPEYSA